MKRSDTVTSKFLNIKRADWPLQKDFIADWDFLYEKTPHASVFCRLEWILSGIEIYGLHEEVAPYRFYDENNELQAIGIFHILKEKGRFSTRTIFRTIDNNSQKIVPLLAANKEHMTQAILTLRETLGQRIDYFDFFKLEGQNDDLAELKGYLQEVNIPYDLKTFNEQPQFLLQTSWENYLELRTQGHRKKIRRYTRKLQEEYDDYKFIRLQTPNDFSAYGEQQVMDEIMELFCCGWQYSALQKESDNAYNQLMEFYQLISQRFMPLGLLDICLLKADGNLLAFELNLCEKGSVYMLFGSYNPDYADWSPGNAILSEIIQDSFKQNYHSIEFGGEYLDYKKLWTKDFSYSYHLRIYGKTIRSRIKTYMRAIKK
jgi:hypothetical protein